ncbi:MAG: hypothetical protein H6R35_399, partial [Bacteroidetes bacterium]|nr:hypothetical protein [Bacteroidota bacterium]
MGALGLLGYSALSPLSAKAISA